MRAAQAIHCLDQLASFPVVMTDYSMIREAAELSQRDLLSFWDSLIIVSAVRSGAEVLYSEDLQNSRVVRGLRIVNPFLAS